MASIHREISIEASAARVWDALRDVGALHTRLAPGFVIDTHLAEGVRVVTFANGMVARELVVDVCDERMRVAWAVVESRMIHHNASAQVFPEGVERCRFVWIADLLPDAAADGVGKMMDQGLQAIRRALEASR